MIGLRDQTTTYCLSGLLAGSLLSSNVSCHPPPRFSSLKIIHIEAQVLFAEDSSLDNLTAIDPIGFVSHDLCLIKRPLLPVIMGQMPTRETTETPLFASLQIKAMQYPSANRKLVAQSHVICESKMLSTDG